MCSKNNRFKSNRQKWRPSVDRSINSSYKVPTTYSAIK